MNDQQIDFGFVLPHWFYWGWLAVMPIVMIIVCYALEKRQFEKDGTLPQFEQARRSRSLCGSPTRLFA
jgi:acyl-coenzyme A synthetase/AMP-(fatty) acid ligase